MHRKGCGKSFLAFSKDHTVRREAWAIFFTTLDLCTYEVLINLKGIRFNESLPNWSSNDTKGPELVWKAMLFRTSLDTSTKKTKMWFCDPDPENPALRYPTHIAKKLNELFHEIYLSITYIWMYLQIYKKKLPEEIYKKEHFLLPPFILLRFTINSLNIIFKVTKH